jgi:repressor LexA
MHPRQIAIYKYIKGFIRENGFPPSRREIAEGTEIPLTCVQYHLNALNKDGHLGKRPGLARGIIVYDS